MRVFPHQTIGATHRLVALVLTMLLVGAACGQSSAESQDDAGAPASTTAEGVEDASTAPDGQSQDQGLTAETDSPLADLITELPPAPTGLPTLEPPPRKPIGLTIDALDIDVAAVIDVGVEDNGDMEIPPADKVGWYRYGPTPGAPEGASVLAAHIAFDGENGVFVNLDQLPLGSIIEVSFDDGSSAQFEAVDKEQYDKAELPRDRVWGRDGDPRLVLITCGGDFNRQISSYDDNVVIYAVPLEPAG